MPIYLLRVGLLALLLGLDCPLFSQYGMTVESAPAVGFGGTVYRFYVHAEDPSDKFSAVYGTDEEQLSILTPSGIFNSAFNTSWNASGINPAFFSIAPDMADDSYATVGLTGAASLAEAGSADPSLVEDPALSPSVSEYFLNGGTSLSVNTLTGASWYVLSMATNALPVNGRWLIMQVTTAGSISGQINYQVFPLGDGNNEVRVSQTFNGTGTYPQEDVAGCTSSNACNFDNAATLDDGSCVFCGCENDAGNVYSMTVEPSAATVDGLTRHRFYVNMLNADDTFSAVFGNAEHPLQINVPDGAYNSGFNTSWNASGLNPVFVSQFPEMADDTYGTVGLTGPASVSEIPDAADPTLVEDPEQDLAPFFLTDGATELLSNMVVGSSWFVLNDAGNARPDNDLKVMIMQITTAGTLSGLINVQLFPNGLGENAQVLTFSIDGPGTFSALGEANACGCTSEDALNFDPDAEYDDGTCLFDVPGCTDSEACNFVDNATTDDGTCLYDDALGTCGGTCPADEDSDGLCDDIDPCVGAFDACGVCNGPGEIYACGCTDLPEGSCDCNGNVLDECGVCNGPGAVYDCGCTDIPEGDCDCDGNQATEFYDCNGNCTQDDDADGICDDLDPCIGPSEVCCTDYNQNNLCDVDEVVGCTFPSAPNYDPLATMDNGTCIASCYADLNGDGHIQLNDLLDLLQYYDTFCD